MVTREARKRLEPRQQEAIGHAYARSCLGGIEWLEGISTAAFAPLNLAKIDEAHIFLSCIQLELSSCIFVLENCSLLRWPEYSTFHDPLSPGLIRGYLDDQAQPCQHFACATWHLLTMALQKHRSENPHSISRLPHIKKIVVLWLTGQALAASCGSLTIRRWFEADPLKILKEVPSSQTELPR